MTEKLTVCSPGSSGTGAAIDSARGIGTDTGGPLPGASEIEMTLPSDRPDNSAYCCARFLASPKASARASLTSVESSSMEKVTELIRVASPPAVIEMGSDEAELVLTWVRFHSKVLP